MIRARLFKTEYDYKHELVIVKENRDGSRAYFGLPTIHTFESGEMVQPFMAASVDEGLVTDFLQAIADCAWEAGIYPRKLADKTDELKATKYHLEDMRTLALGEGGK